MSDDILTRLRNYIPGENDDWVPQRIAEAADEIERLREALPDRDRGWGEYLAGFRGMVKCPVCDGSGHVDEPVRGHSEKPL